MIRRVTAALAMLCAALAFNPVAQADTNENLGFMNWDAEAAQAAIDNGERVIVNGWATWCPLCKAQRRALNGLLSSDPEGYADVKVFSIDIDWSDAPDAIGDNPLRKTMLVFYGDGEEIDVYEGRDAEQMASILSMAE